MALMTRPPSMPLWALAIAALVPCLAAGPVAAQPTELEEIIVTATKRPLNIQDVPVAVTAMNARMIEETLMETLQRLTDLDPSVKFDQAHSYQNASLKIRGIGTIGVSRTFEGAVGAFVDGVYRSRSGMALADLLDIDDLEILRGPQGTLFGKNTVAGAIALNSTRPMLGETDGRVELRAGTFDSRYLTGVFNGALGESSAMRLAGVYHARDGTFRSPDNADQYDAIDRYAFKSQFLLNPTDDVSLLVIADFARSDADCCWASAQVVNGPTSPLIDTYAGLNGLTFTHAPYAEQDRSISLNTLPRETIRDRGVAATLDWHLGPNKELKSITAFRDWRHDHIDADPDFVPADLFVLNEPADIKNVSQELNVRLLVRRTSLLAGFYYATEGYRGTRSVISGHDADNYLNALISASFGATACLPPVISLDCAFPAGIGALLPTGEFTRENYAQDSTAYALFGHATTPLSGKFDLVTGLRYSDERKRGGVDNVFWYDSAIARAALAAAGVPDDGTPRNGLDLVGTRYSPSFRQSTRDKEWTGVLALQYQPTNELMIYGSYQRGFKAGGVNLYREAVLTDTTAYAPEFADGFEVGAKVTYLDGRARTNVAAFDTQFSNLQINFFDGLNFRTENAGEARTRGVEIENYFQLTDELRMDFSATYLHSKFTEIRNPLLAYLADRDTPRAPRWAAAWRLNYEKPLGDRLTLLVRGGLSYTGDHFVGADVPDETKVESYLISDASVGVRNQRRGWEVLAWCTNCGDQTYRTIYFNSTFQPGSYSAYLNTPAEYGVALRKSF
jgi:iron complex outermembrane receptor protein